MVSNLKIWTLQISSKQKKKKKKKRKGKIIDKVLQFPSTNKIKRQKDTNKRNSENWECWDGSNKTREGLKWL